jgi:hypothetical protein
MIPLHKRVASRFLKLADQQVQDEPIENDTAFGGKGPFILPDEHIAGMVVPKGGSSCANCRFADVRDDGPHCTESNWVAWNGGESRLPVDDPETYCSDWYQSSK